jgi:hypothetical protein
MLWRHLGRGSQQSAIPRMTTGSGGSAWRHPAASSLSRLCLTAESNLGRVSWCWRGSKVRMVKESFGQGKVGNSNDKKEALELLVEDGVNEDT